MSSQPSVKHSPKHLILAIGGLLLFLSWFTPGLDAAWQVADERVFRAMNGLLGLHPDLDRLWARSNQRWFDAASGVPLAAMMLCWIFAGGRNDFRRRGAQMFVAVGLLALARVAVEDVMEMVDYRRKSPSLVMEGALLLKRVVPHIKAKYASQASFPGDHALVSSWIALTFALLATRRMAIAAACIVAVAWLPRLVSGAHWLTDDVVGGLGIAMTAIGLAMWSGLFYQLVRLIEWIARWLGYKFGIAWFQDPEPTEAESPTSR